MSPLINHFQADREVDSMQHCNHLSRPLNCDTQSQSWNECAVAGADANGESEVIKHEDSREDAVKKLSIKKINSKMVITDLRVPNHTIEKCDVKIPEDLQNEEHKIDGDENDYFKTDVIESWLKLM